MGIPAQQAAKATRPLMPAAAPAVLLHSLDTQQKACIFTTQKALRENTCAIASGDYSTPVSQRRNGVGNQGWFVPETDGDPPWYG